MHRDSQLQSGTIAARWTQFGLILLALVSCSWGATSAFGVAYVRLDYNLELASRARNTAFIELFDTDRPLTTTNFLQYVNGDRYDGSIMHRLSRNFVIQGGGFYPELQEEPFPLSVSLDPTATVDLDGNPQTANPTVMNEFANSPMRPNARGTLSMAKMGGNPDSASNQWFVNLNNNSGTPPNGLDFQNGGFTVFARVLGDGMTLFDAMNAVQIGNLNPDANNNGTRDEGPFGLNANDGVPLFPTLNNNNEIVNNFVILDDAERIDYFGAGVNTNVGGGLNFTTRDAFIDTGTGFTGAGSFTVGAGRTLGIRENFLTGRLITNNGILAPGLQLGSVTIGSLNQSNTGILDIQLGGTTVNTGYDRLVVTNAAQLGGTLDVSLLDDFKPAADDTFTVLTANLITGSFSDINLPTLDAGLVWNLNVSTMAVSLGVAAADFNRDGIVNTADYTLWQDTRGATVTAFSGADADGNGMVNDADYTIWKNNFGNLRGGVPGFGAGAAALAQAVVPEPNVVILLASAALLSSMTFTRREIRAHR